MASLYDRISKGTILVDEITESMIRSTSEGGKYFGSMDKQSQTLEGRMSTLKDTINSSLGEALSGILQKLSDTILPKVTEAIEKVDWEALGTKLSDIFTKLIDLGTWVINHFDTVSTLILAVGAAFVGWKVGALIMSIVKAFTFFTAAVKAGTVAQLGMNAAMTANPIGAIIMAIVALITIIVLLVKNWDKVKEAFIKTWEKIKEVWGKVANWFKEKVIDPIANFFSGLWEGIANAFNAVVNFIKENWQGLLLFIVNPVAGVFKLLYDNCEGFRNVVDNVINSIKNFFSNLWSSIKNGASNAWNGLVNGVKSVIEKIKNLFKFKIEFPKLKAPKFSINPQGWKVGDLLKGSIPKLSVKWNADGAIFNKPAIFDTKYGLQGVGEAGSEAIAPIDKLQTYVQSAVKEETNGLAYNIERMYDILATFLPQLANGQNKNIVLDSGVLVGNLAPQMNVKLGEIYKANGRGR